MGKIANDKMAKPWLTSGKKQRFLTMGSREQFVKTLSFRRKTLICFHKTLHCFCAFVSPSRRSTGKISAKQSFVVGKSTDAYWQYQSSLDAYRTALNVYDSAMEQGLEQGLEQGMEQGIAKGEDLKVKEIVLRSYKTGLSLTQWL
jgi:hypothetical protein